MNYPVGFPLFFHEDSIWALTERERKEMGLPEDAPDWDETKGLQGVNSAKKIDLISTGSSYPDLEDIFFVGLNFSCLAIKDPLYPIFNHSFFDHSTIQPELVRTKRKIEPLQENDLQPLPLTEIFLNEPVNKLNEPVNKQSDLRLQIDSQLKEEEEKSQQSESEVVNKKTRNFKKRYFKRKKTPVVKYVPAAISSEEKKTAQEFKKALDLPSNQKVSGKGKREESKLIL